MKKSELVHIKKLNKTESLNKKEKVKSKTPIIKVFIPQRGNRNTHIRGKISKERERVVPIKKDNDGESEIKQKKFKKIKDNMAMEGNCIFFQGIFIKGIIYDSFSLFSYIRNKTLEMKGKKEGEDDVI